MRGLAERSKWKAARIFENSEAVFKKIDAAKELKKKRRLSQKENNESSCLIDEEPKACGKACVIS